MPITEFTSYKVVRYGNYGGQTGAYIHCFDAGGAHVLTCVFWNDEANVPTNTQGATVLLYYPISSFGSVLHLVQSEMPMYFNYIAASNVGFLSTSQEPVGEEEGV